MTDQHLITPLPELVDQWADMLSHRSDHDVFALAARWGADQELEACCGFIGCEHSVAWSSKLRTSRRPKPPSLKEQALNLLNNHNNGWTPSPKQWQTIRIAIEALPND